MGGTDYIGPNSRSNKYQTWVRKREKKILGQFELKDQENKQKNNGSHTIQEKELAQDI